MTKPCNRPLYERLLGDDWHKLPPQLRAMHEVAPLLSADGLAVVERGGGIIAQTLATLGGLPRAGQSVPLSVRMAATPSGESWERSFAGRRFNSRQSLTRVPRGAPLLQERAGLVKLTFELKFNGERLTLAPVGWRLLGLPLPRSLIPVSRAYEYVDDHGRFSFLVESALPVVGLIVRYSGWLKPAAAVEMDKISRR